MERWLFASRAGPGFSKGFCEREPAAKSSCASRTSDCGATVPDDERGDCTRALDHWKVVAPEDEEGDCTPRTSSDREAEAPVDDVVVVVDEERKLDEGDGCGFDEDGDACSSTT